VRAKELARPPQIALPVTDEFAEVLTMRGLWFGLLIAVPCWFILALLFVALF
jgi:hypothetical protein